MPEKIDQINKLIKALPLPKKGLYKLKDNINLDDYIAILQSKRENKTYTINALELGGSSTGIQSLTAGTNITVDNTDPLNPIVSASSSLFPNGHEIVTESRDFRDSDIGKILVVVGNDITLTMPDSIVFSEQLRTIGLVFLKGYTGCGYQPSHGFTTKVLQLPNDGEFITLITGEYLGKSSVGTIANMQVNSDDGIVTLNKYLYDQSQNVIPLSGTEVGKPVTGDVSIQDDLLWSLKNNQQEIVFNDDGSGVQIIANSGTEQGILNIGSNSVTVSSTDTTSRGISGMQDFSANITDLDYTQKIYVGYRGTATLVGGTVTVATDKIKTGYKIYVSVNTPSGTQGFLSAPTGSIVDATSFVINSTSVLDDSTVNWWIAP